MYFDFQQYIILLTWHGMTNMTSFYLFMYFLQDMDEDVINEAIEDTTVGIYLLKEQASADEQEDIRVVLEGLRVVKNLDNVAFAVVMLFGLMYALKLAYPADLRYTFEVFQKVFMELDGTKLSNKVLALKNRLFH